MPDGKHHKEAIEHLNKMMNLMGKEASDEESFGKLCKAIVVRKNKEYASPFSSAGFKDRIIFLPQCLRRVDFCKAKESSSGYICRECGACTISKVIAEARRIGYKSVHILKGGRAVIRILDEQKPCAVVGVGCDFEGALGIMECEKRKIPVQFIPLSKDGCFETEVDFEEIKSVLNFIEISEPEDEK